MGVKNIISKRQLEKDRDTLRFIIYAMGERDYYGALTQCKLSSDVFVLDVNIVEKELLNNIFYDIANNTSTSIDYAKGALEVVEEKLGEMGNKNK